MMRITIISPEAFGYIDFLVDALKTYPKVEVLHINFSSFVYKYHSFFDRAKNAVSKVLLGKNIKVAYRSKCSLEMLSETGKQDVILVVRPDKIDEKTVAALKAHTDQLYAFYFDAIQNFPEKVALIPFFDQVFSYEPEDVSRYHLKFLTNFIYDRDRSSSSGGHQVFNISSFDERFDILKTMAQYFKDHEITYRIMVRRQEARTDPLLTMIPKHLTIDQVKPYLLEADVLLDVQKGNQHGLSFRVFEALGYEKKLITTNLDIVNYDFYNPNNILVLDVNAIHIPKAFLETPYEKVSESVLYPYTLQGWIETVFGIV